MADNYIARKHSSWKVVSLVPDVCKTPMGSAIVPVPYPVTAQLKSATNVAKHTNANGKPVVLFDRSHVPKTIGDKAGRAFGIKSNTVEGKCYPNGKSSTVRVEGKFVVRHDDLFWMNGL